MNQTVYIKLDQVRLITQTDVFLGKMIEIWCKDEAIKNRCKAIKLDSVPDENGRHLYSALDIIKKIQEEYPNVEVENLGEKDTILEYRKNRKLSLTWEWTKLAVIFLIIFIGSAFAIITFNNDVNVGEVFRKIYQLTTGQESNGFTIIEIMYSIGLPLGIMGFYNHFSKKKETSDPTPLEVEMRIYEQDIYTTVVKNSEKLKINSKGKNK